LGGRGCSHNRPWPSRAEGLAAFHAEFVAIVVLGSTVWAVQ
jgi:hypothetical protein